MKITEVPLPNLQSGMVLVRNLYSLISAGTESGTVKAARKGYLGKALEKPQHVKQVLNTLKTQGPVQTYRAVMKKLDAWSPLGYSCVGEIVELAPDIHDLASGDYVACGGATASHAEVVAVPRNLCVKLPLQGQMWDGSRESGVKGEETEGNRQDTAALEVYLKQAAYNTLGAIALQGIRQADLRLGESCAVIGLGLLGQLTALMLEASGVGAIGVDVDPAMVDFAGLHGLAHAFLRDDPGIESKILACTGGMGCDAVIITAGSASVDPINFAGAIARKRGTVVVVGAVPTGFDRDPHFYKKELTVKMSCSYGPGRYDPEYEEKGRDYPVGYVRWTENRNMQAFQDLIYRKKINIGHLTTHVFKLEEASAAYDLILEKSEPYVGILIEYEQGKELKKGRVVTGPAKAAAQSVSRVSIGFIGAGSYAQSHLLPHLKSMKDVVLQGVMTSTPASARSVAERFGFAFCTSDEREIFGDAMVKGWIPDQVRNDGEKGLDSRLRGNDNIGSENDNINTVFIATRHDSHGWYVLGGLRSGKHVFVEKPLCLNETELEAIRETYIAVDGSDGVRPHLMVGFNRRFSPLTALLKKKIGGGPMAMIYRVNAGRIPKDSWVQDWERGGGRIVGEVCHFVDYLTFLNGSLPCSVFAAVLPDLAGCEDTVTINLQFQNGSIGSIAYFANGSKGLFKEYVEVHQAGVTAVLKDFKELSIYGDGRPYSKKLLSQDKGQKEMVRAFVGAVRDGGATPIPFEEIYTVTLATFRVLESVRKRQAVDV